MGNHLKPDAIIRPLAFPLRISFVWSNPLSLSAN